MKVFFKADAANGYWAIPLAEEHCYKTAFHTVSRRVAEPALKIGPGIDPEEVS